MTQLWQYSAKDLARAFRRGDTSPIELVDSIFGRCPAVNSSINALVHIDEAGARRTAAESERRWRQGCPLGHLDGIPLTVKDNLLVKGMPATWGSSTFARFEPEADEIPIARLRNGGAVFLGKTNVPEFTLQGYTSNRVFGTTRNPWDLKSTPGGSSGGAVAAVASGLGPLAVGTDGGGSIRRPAGYTGLVGFKPSLGRIARGNGFPPILYDLEVIGLTARTVLDVTMLYECLNGPDPRDRRSFVGLPEDTPSSVDPVHARRILYVPRFGNLPVDPEIESSVNQVARQFTDLRHEIEEGDVPFDFEAVNSTLATVFSTGLAWLVRDRDWGDNVNEGLRPLLESGRRTTGPQYLQAISDIWQFRTDVVPLFDSYDFILTPTSAAPAWRAEAAYPEEIAGHAAGPRDHAVYTGFANVAGLPGVSIPGPPSRRGMPIGFQIVGGFGRDRDVLELASQYEATHPWGHLWPPTVSDLA